MRKAAGIVIFGLMVLQASAQFNVEFHSGYASYSNSELKSYQSSFVGGFLPGGKVLESFPSFWYYGVDAKWNLPTAQVGLSISQGSTGGQIYYADYSGTFREQQMLKYTSVRMLTAVRLPFNNGNTSIQFDPRFGLAFGKLNVNSSVSASDGTDSFGSNQSSDYKAVNPFVEPTLSISQKIGPVGISLFAGYHLDLASNYYRQTNGGALNAYGGVEVPMNLTGIRAGGSIGFHLGRPKEIDFTRFYFGLGLGLDFGGIFGLNAMSMATEHVGFFGALGFNLDKAGMNGGVRIYANKQSSSFRPFFSLMYGYNAVYLIKGGDKLNRTFYGTTLGTGVDFKDARSNFWTVSLLFPFRSEDVRAYKTYLNSSGVKIDRDLFPVTFSVGYRIAIVK